MTRVWKWHGSSADEVNGNVIYHGVTAKKILYKGQTIWEKGMSGDFMFEITGAVGSSIQIRVSGDVMIDFGDGLQPTHVTSDTPMQVTGRILSAGSHTVTISGELTGITFVSGSVLSKILTPLPETISGDLSNFCYRQTALTSIPSGLFSNIKNAVSLASAFNGCTSLYDVPADVFKGASGVTSMQNLFYGCTNLTEIPNGFFDGCSGVTTLQSAFYQSGVTSIGQTALRGLTANGVNMSSMFRYCSGLTQLPVGLFDGLCPRQMNYMFANTRLVFFPVTLFDALRNNDEGVSLNTSYMFTGLTTLTCAAPTLWDGNYTFITTHTQMFRSCTNMSNYSSIPSGWR